MQYPRGLVEISSYPMSCELLIYAELVFLGKCPIYQNYELERGRRLTV